MIFEQIHIKRALTVTYFAIGVTLFICEFIAAKSVIFIVKPFLIPVLWSLYIYTSQRRNILYIAALFAALSSNILFLSTSPTIILLGIIAFVVFIILIITVAIRMVKKIYLVAFLIATLPFLIIYACLINLTMGFLGVSLYAAITNGFLMSILCGLALSNFIINDDKMSSYLAISAMLFGVLNFIFIIQKYYLANIVFPPLSALTFTFAHFAFYKFVLEGEKSR